MTRRERVIRALSELDNATLLEVITEAVPVDVLGGLVIEAMGKRGGGAVSVNALFGVLGLDEQSQSEIDAEIAAAMDKERL